MPKHGRATMEPCCRTRGGGRREGDMAGTAKAATGYKQSLGADGPPGSYDDLDAADLFVVLGANMADCHPILYLRMMDRVRRGAKLVVVDPRRTATAAKADVHLPVSPGTDL